jgi:DNA-binding CsgD family transcriptional regulator
MGTICYRRYGVVIGYERAVQAPDQRLRVMAQILAHVVGTLATPHAAIATVHRDGQIGAVLPWRRFPEGMRERYVASYSRHDLLAPARFSGHGHTVVSVDDVGGRERFRRTAYGEFLAQAGVEAVGAMYLRRHGRIVAGIKLLRELGAAALTTDEIAMARRLHPLIEIAYVASLGPAQRFTPDDLLERAKLTRREADVVRLAAIGASNTEIATSLLLSVATVKIHLHHAFVKLGVRSRAELAARMRPVDGGSPIP